MRDSVIPAARFSGALFSFSRLLLPPGMVVTRAGLLPSTRGKVGSEDSEECEAGTAARSRPGSAGEPGSRGLSDL